MSTPPPASTSTADKTYELQRRPAKRRIPFFRLALLLLVVAVALLFEPHCFQFAIRQFLWLEAWRNGVTAKIGKVEGSLFEPVRILDSVWIYESDDGPVTRVEVKEVEADVSFRALLQRGAPPWFQALKIDGLTGKVQIPIETAASVQGRRFHIPRPQGRWVSGPERVEARNVDFIFQSDGDYVRLQNARFSISENEPGEVLVGQLTIRQPWLNRVFRNVKGATKLESARTELAAVALEPGVTIENLSVELEEIVRGRLNLEMQLAAFGGDIRIETQTLPQDRQLAFEANGTFSQIAIGKLATFLGKSEAAGGTIKEGKFTFRGTPQAPAKSTASLRIEATNFQWESRQWDSLVFGASLLDGRVQIPTLTLYQGHNFLNLRGEFALPADRQQWWQNEFSFDVNAKIENLTELSALMLPEFKYAAGKGTIDGSVRGDHQQFHGQIIVSGSNLTWRSAPIDELHATLKLNGNELQLANLAIFNDGDYVRGRGVVNILGEKQYWGELRASIDDLARYSAILQKPIVPEPMAGGAVIDWTGEGSAQSHTGKFFARLRKLRSLGATSALLHPINADFEGSYQPGAILFDRFALSDDASSFTANVAVGKSAVSVRDIRFMQGGTLQLEGEALLPLDVWQAWPNTNLATLLNDTTASKIHLTATGFDLHSASQLTGWNFPVQGSVRGEITAEGPLGAIASSGHVSLADGVIPLGWTGVVLRGVSADAALDGQKLAVTKLAGRHSGGDVEVRGEVDFKNVRDPLLHLALTSARTECELFPASGRIRAEAALSLTIDGPSGAAKVGGEAKLLSLHPPVLDLAPILLNDAPVQATDLFEAPRAAWNAWRLDLACTFATPLPIGADTAGTASGNLRLLGTVADPALSGVARFGGLPARIGDVPVKIDEAALEFRDSAPRDPSATLRVSGSALGTPFSAQAAGPLSHLIRTFDCEPPLDPASLRAFLRGSPSALDGQFSLLTPAAQVSGVAVYSWAPIDGGPAVVLEKPPGVVPP